MRRRILFWTVSVGLLMAVGAEAVAAFLPGSFRRAVNLYEKGLYSEAKTLFDGMDDPLSAGYSALCAAALRENGCLGRIDGCLDAYPESVLEPRLRWAKGNLLFDDGLYGEALKVYSRIPVKELYKRERNEFLYKKAYCLQAIGRDDEAADVYARVTAAGPSDYQAPAEYALGYLAYKKEHFKEAEKHFKAAAGDPRFKDIAEYYLVECRFMRKDYAYTVREGTAIYDRIPDERKPHLGRMISESYLVLGDVEGANKYYEQDLAGKVPKNRSDYFYAGSLLYALKNYKGAVENYEKMEARTDSIGQIANYHMGFSRIQLKDKVSALDAFRDAAGVDYDKAIKEDAWFNWAKLAFDINKDGSVFNAYMAAYPSREKSDRIYSYMAMAALYEHDYAAAVRAYDHIDLLDEDMKGNYMKAYYLRAGQLIARGSYRDAAPLLRTAAYYSPKNNPFNQMSRYWLAESLYRDEKYPEAREVLTDLYNLSALDGQPEGDLISYNMAYNYFKEEKYPEALRWFNNYLETDTDTFGPDAETRIGDCYFYSRDYRSAVAAYERKIADYPDPDDIYPYYRAAVASGLLGDNARKISFLDKVKNASPSSKYWSESMYELGRAYVTAGDVTSATRTFRTLKGGTTDPTYQARSLIELGMLEGNAGNDDAALAHYREVVSSMPGSEYAENALLAIENIYRKKQDPDGYLAYVNSLGKDNEVGEGRKETVYFNTVEQMYLGGNYEKALAGMQGYLEKYPSGAYKGQAYFYMGECCRLLGRRDKACDYYSEAIEEGDGQPYLESAIRSWSDLSFALGHFSDAYKGYRTLAGKTGLQETLVAARTGMMRSAYRAQHYDDAIAAAKTLDSREAKYILAKSCLATSRRDEAFRIFRELSEYPSTDEGAEAMYLVIQDMYDRGEFDTISEKVYEFSGKAAGQNYWLAKAYITLGDTFVEQGNREQARVTFESIRSGYTPRQGREDDVLDQVNIRLERL